MKREHLHGWSDHLQRKMDVLIFGHTGAKVLVFPTRCGRYYEYETLRIIDQMQSKIEDGYFQFFCVDSIDEESFYCNWAHPSGRIQRHIQFEKYIIEELFPQMDARNSNPCTISHGCSLGAYHATNIAFRHPHRFQKLVALSGRFDLTLQVEDFRDLFDGYYTDDVYYHTPTHFLPNLEGEAVEHIQNMDIQLVIGKKDPFLENNLLLVDILQKKGATPHLHIWEDRAHRGYYWRKMAPLYL